MDCRSTSLRAAGHSDVILPDSPFLSHPCSRPGVQPIKARLSLGICSCSVDFPVQYGALLLILKSTQLLERPTSAPTSHYVALKQTLCKEGREWNEISYGSYILATVSQGVIKAPPPTTDLMLTPSFGLDTSLRICMRDMFFFSGAVLQQCCSQLMNPQGFLWGLLTEWSMRKGLG